MKASDWSGAIGDSWASSWRETDRSFAALDAVLVERVAAKLAGADMPRLLDIGCGAGSTSLAVAACLPNAKITGIDLSAALVGVATARAGNGPACRFAVADAGVWRDATDLDLLFSRHGVMFFDDPVAALSNLRAVAKPGAALIFSCFRAPGLNPWAMRTIAALPTPPVPASPDAPGPFAFADPARVRSLLAAAGWSDIVADPVDYDYVAAQGPDPVTAAIDFFLRIGPAATPARALDAAAHTAFRDRLAIVLADYRDGDRIVFPAAAWIWTARA